MDYNIRLEYQLPPTEDSGDMLVSAFESFSPAAGPTDAGTSDVWITVQAADVRQAIAIGLALSQQAVDAQLASFEVITTEEFDRRQWKTPIPELVGSDDAAEMLGMSRQAVVKKFTAGGLPGLRVGERTIVFARRDVERAAEDLRTRRPGETAVEQVLRRIGDETIADITRASRKFTDQG